MEKYLIVVDMQNDFVSGSLGTREAEEIVPKVVEKVISFKGKIIFTQDTHGKNYLDMLEGKMLPVEHCIEGTEGWQLIPELKEVVKHKETDDCHVVPFAIYQKSTFGSTELALNLKREYEEKGIESIEIVGLCTDVCVISNALLLKSYMPELPIFVDASCCAGITPQKHEMALGVMESCHIRRSGEEMRG